MKPLKFQPILKQTLWGGDKIVPFKHATSKLQNVGESWEISGLQGNETVVKEGEFAGQSLAQVLGTLKEALVGKANYARFGNEFPLLIKFIDAREPLSIQVHPTDEIALRQGKNRGKTEMWYVMDAAPDAGLLVGLTRKITPEEYKQKVADNTITDVIGRYGVEVGDCFFLPAGRIHSIGAGCFLAEIQQASDVTYRIYDFNRKDSDGNLRTLHTREAAECIDFNVVPDCRTDYQAVADGAVNLADCPYFTTELYDVKDIVTVGLAELDSFAVFIVVEGEGIATDSEGHQETLRTGDVLLYPATSGDVRVSGHVKFLQTYVKS